MEQALLAIAPVRISANVIIPFIPVVAVLVGALIALWRQPGEGLSSAIQHFAAGVVFAAAAAEILPQVKHEGAIVPTAIGGILGVATMLAIKKLGQRWKGPTGMLSAIGIDLFVDGVVLGLAFLAGEKAGVLLAFALTLEGSKRDSAGLGAALPRRGFFARPPPSGPRPPIDPEAMRSIVSAADWNPWPRSALAAACK